MNNKCLDETVDRIVKRVLNEYLDKDYMVPLKKYMNLSDNDKAAECADLMCYHLIPYMEQNANFEEKINELIQNGKLPKDLFDYENYEIGEIIGGLFYNDLSEFSDDFVKYCTNTGDTNMPLFCVAFYEGDVYNEWLIHMTDNSSDISREGFINGAEMDELAYTKDHASLDNFPGYNFAFMADNAYDAEHGGWRGNTKYGDEVILFQASGIKVWHSGDEEHQVIFYGPTAKNIIMITKDYDYGQWCVYSEINGNVLCRFDELQDIVYWCISNFAQYGKHLIGNVNQRVQFERNKPRS